VGPLSVRLVPAAGTRGGRRQLQMGDLCGRLSCNSRASLWKGRYRWRPSQVEGIHGCTSDSLNRSDIRFDSRESVQLEVFILL